MRSEFGKRYINDKELELKIIITTLEDMQAVVMEGRQLPTIQPKIIFFVKQVVPSSLDGNVKEVKNEKKPKMKTRKVDGKKVNVLCKSNMKTINNITYSDRINRVKSWITTINENSTVPDYYIHNK